MYPRLPVDVDSSPSQPEFGNRVAERFCLIRWSDRNDFSIVAQRYIRASSNPIQVYETYTIEIDGKQRKGTLILIGTKEECERLQQNVSPRSSTAKSNRSTAPDTQPFSTALSSSSSAISDDGDGKDTVVIRSAVLMKILQMVLTRNASGNENANGGEEIHKVQCGACHTYPIRSDRYKCLNCENLDMCGQCFERRTVSRHHSSGHVFVHFKSPGELFGQAIKNSAVTFENLKRLYAQENHESISCDGCGRESIIGLRFKCDTCPRYDLCQECVDNDITTKTHVSSHPLIVTPRRVIEQIPVEDIELGDQLGKGGFGAVFKARWLSKNRTVACKVIAVPNAKGAEVLEKSFLKELAAYAELSGAYILKTYGFAAARQGQEKKYMLLMEYMSRGSLADLIEKKSKEISLRRKLDMARNIASGMRKIHQRRMIHRDIRPDNILVNENYVAKIGDMGIARFVDPLNKHTQIGCQPYMPPEFYRGDYDQKLDIFTFGLTLNELFTSTKHSFQPFINDRIAFREKSPIFDDLIGRCTVNDPQRRPTAAEIEKILDLYAAAFVEIVLKKNPKYLKLSTEEKDGIFVEFYEKFHPAASEFIRKKFPTEFNDETTDLPGVKVDKNAGDGIQISCPIQ